MPTIAFHTLGCKVNQGETAAMAHLFQKVGYQVISFDDVADIYVINTCAVTIQAERKSRQMAHRARETNPKSLVVLAGCYPQVAKTGSNLLAGIDLLVGSADKHRIVDLIEQALQSEAPVVAVSPWEKGKDFAMISGGQESERTRATLKIQDGCRQFCSYCIIPYARGPERSRPVADVLQEAQELVADGYQEIVITGIHVGSYGHDLPGQPDLAGLIEQILQLPGLKRLRLSSIEPNEVSERLIILMQQHSNFCRHLHIPLQSGNDKVLHAMNRRYTTEDYLQTINLTRSLVPEIAITTDIIVGFPGETDAEFDQTYKLVEQIGFSRLHVFRYSRRPGTPAASMEQQIPKKIKAARSRALIALGKRMADEFADSLIGSKQDVLWESQNKAGVWMGHTDTYVKVYGNDVWLQPNLITNCTLSKKNNGTRATSSANVWCSRPETR